MRPHPEDWIWIITAAVVGLVVAVALLVSGLGLS